MRALAVFIFLHAFSCTSAQDSITDMRKIEAALTANTKSTGNILSAKEYMYLHPLTSFRKIIMQNTRDAAIRITGTDEPGTALEADVKLLNSKGLPLANCLVYFYHTDNNGWYGLTGTHVTGNDGDRRHARLFGYARSDKNGRVKINTIMPQGYPGSELPAHIHFEVKAPTGTLVTELLFDGDLRLTPVMQRRMEAEGAYISKTTIMGNRRSVNYTITVK